MLEILEPWPEGRCNKLSRTYIRHIVYTIGSNLGIDWKYSARDYTTARRPSTIIASNFFVGPTGTRTFARFAYRDCIRLGPGKKIFYAYGLACWILLADGDPIDTRPALPKKILPTCIYFPARLPLLL